MKHLLSRENMHVLAELAVSRTLLAFDFDGTLAPIVEDREQANMRQTTAALLTRLCTLYPCAVISGRKKADVARRLCGARVKYVIGNHGLEPGANLDEYAHDMVEARRVLEAELAGEKGVDLEDKKYSLALHYRRSRQKRNARAAILRAVSILPSPMRIVPGKLVMNLVPARAPNKGEALLELLSRETSDRALYVGDDITDEDVFRLEEPRRILGVRVGESEASAAEYSLRDQREIDRLLSKLVALRERRRTP